MLLKGLQDVAVAPDPHEAATMALLRLIHAADLPDPAALLARLASGQGGDRRAGRGAVRAAPATRADRRTAGRLSPRLVERSNDDGKRILAQATARPGRAGALRAARIWCSSRCGRSAPTWARELAAALKAVDRHDAGQVSFTDAGGEPSLQQQEKIAEEQVRAAVLDEPNVRALLDAFPDADARNPFNQRKVPDMPDFDLDKIMEMAQNAQAELQKAQDNLDKVEVEGASGGGLVKIRATAKGRILGVSIDDSLLVAAEKSDARGSDRRRAQRRQAPRPMPPPRPKCRR